MVAQLRGCEFEVVPSNNPYEPSNKTIARQATEDVAYWLGYEFTDVFLQAQESDPAEVRRRLDVTP